MLKKKITAIIPTLGKKDLSKILKKLSNNNLIKEIIISIPKSQKKNFYIDKKKNIKIIYSNFKHQVKQRIICFKRINSEFTLFLDDDINFDNKFVYKLFKFKLNKGHNSVIGPIYYDKNNFTKIHKLEKNFKGIIKRFIQSIFFGVPFSKKRMGKISRAGTCYGVDPDHMQKNYINVDWMPGGCMILSTKNLIYENYFNIKGKAYCEDLIQSYLYRKKKLKLFIYKKAKIYTESPKKLNSKKDLQDYLKGHKLFCKHSKLKNLRVTIWRTFLTMKLNFLY